MKIDKKLEYVRTCLVYKHLKTKAFYTATETNA